MLPLDHVSLKRLTETVHEERLHELENQRLAQSTLSAQPKVYAALLAGLGRGLVTLGQRMQNQSHTLSERQQTSV